MNKKEQIEIPLSKNKLILTLLGSITFVAIGIWFLVNSSKTNSPILSNETFIFIIGLIAILFFGFIAITVIRKLLDKKPGLIISKQGITDNSSGVSAGLIPWTDIQEIRALKIMNQKFLMFIVKNPQDYVDKVTNPIKRNAIKMNLKSYGSPISISANSLKTNFDNLHRLLLEKMTEYK
ncbi:hypothetical protein EGM88_06690 [Aureibaculum marinum]|uniref:Uncharacterized protein n=1 Tax=Aureibaculum marinum TaxID=2487930 RepID=A0A3N4NU86_9FLAO|nr:STM3941 family protein [Aureibaculum marinum]RPD98247.1 hypothetical protein EGM88_06690 [Aureibaculum marinum]